MKLPKSSLPAAVSLTACKVAILAGKRLRSACAVCGSRPNAQHSHAWVCPSTGSCARTVRSFALVRKETQQILQGARDAWTQRGSRR
eukprot:6141327-Pleurochrysis_carterae.AAC.4